MRLEIVRELAEALADATIGVAAQLLVMPRDALDAAPANPVIVDGTKDDEATQAETVKRGVSTMMLVTSDGPLVTDPANIKGEFSHGTMPVAITIFHNGGRTAHEKLQDVEYLIRAAVLTLKEYFALKTGRVRNEVVVLRCTSLQYGLVQDDGLGALGALVLTVQALDRRAQRTT